MTRALPHTKASIARRIDAALEAGLFVVAILPDNTVLVAHSAPDPDRRELDQATLEAMADCRP